MKHILLINVLITLLVFGVFSCKKSTDDPKTDNVPEEILPPSHGNTVLLKKITYQDSASKRTETAEFFYDDRNRLVEYKGPGLLRNGTSPTDRNFTFEYDNENRLIKVSRFKKDNPVSPDTVFQFTYQGDTVFIDVINSKDIRKLALNSKKQIVNLIHYLDPPPGDFSRTELIFEYDMQNNVKSSQDTEVIMIFNNFSYDDKKHPLRNLGADISVFSYVYSFLGPYMNNGALYLDYILYGGLTRVNNILENMSISSSIYHLGYQYNDAGFPVSGRSKIMAIYYHPVTFMTYEY